MPLPEPKKDENHQEFMNRCMADDNARKEFPDRRQRFKVCQAQAKKKPQT